MIILKYSILFPIYYVLRWNERKDLPKSIAVNILAILIVFMSLQSSSDVKSSGNFHISRQTYKDESDIIKDTFQTDYNGLKNKNKNKESVSEKSTPQEIFRSGKKGQKYAINARFRDTKSYIKRCSENKNIPFENYLFTLDILYNNDETILPKEVINNKSYGKINEDDSIVMFGDLTDDEGKNISEQLEKNVDKDIITIYENIKGYNLTEPQRKQIEAEIEEIGEVTENTSTYPIKDIDIRNVVKEYIKSKRSAIYFDKEIEDVKYTETKKNIEGLYYYWWYRDDVTNKNDRKQLVGEIGEVGYKDSFPIFIQGDPVDKTSKIPWRYGKGYTNLGESGCSLYSLCSLIHAAGYGNQEMPNTDKKPTMENLARIFPSGPVTGMMVANRLGYQLKFHSTASENDLYNLFEDLLIGIPYVVNVRDGLVTGYDDKGNTYKTIFTSSGHYMILKSGKIIDGKRLVEVVQSSRSYAGLSGLDQNSVWFDYDEMVSKGVIRSSQGYPVPAYTITGAIDFPTPVYLSKGDKDSLFRKQELISESEESNWLSDFLSDYDIDIDKMQTEGAEIKSEEAIFVNDETVINYVDDNLLVFIDYNLALMITNIKEKSTIIGKRPADSALGITTSKSKVYIVTKSDDSEVWSITLKEINTKEEYNE